MNIKEGDLILLRNNLGSYIKLRITGVKDPGFMYEIRVVRSNVDKEVGTVDILNNAEIQQILKNDGMLIQTPEEKSFLKLLESE